MGVGKTCLIQRLVTNTFKEEHTSTVGVEFVNYGLMIEESEGVKLQVWDTAGQENFRAITRLFYKDSDAIFLLFSIKDQISFDNLTNWKKDVDQNTKAGAIKYLVGNFSDMNNQRKVSSEEAVNFVQEE